MENKLSISFTALIWIGLLLCIFGAIVSVYGLGGSSIFEGTLGSVKVKTSQTGLVIMLIGALLSFFTAQKLPKGVMVLGDRPSFKEKGVKIIPLVSLVLGFFAMVLLIISLFKTGD